MDQYLTRNQVEELVFENRYTSTAQRYQGRCFSSDYANSEGLPALALPGGDIGELAVLLSASVSYGFACDIVKAVQIIENIVGTAKNTTYQQSYRHTAEQCRYLHFLSETPEIFSLQKENLTDFIHILEKKEMLPIIDKYKAPKSKEKALIIYEGKQGLYPQYIFDTITSRFETSVFIYHKTFVDERRHIITKSLLESHAVTLYENLSDDYLFEVLSDVGDTHLFETLLKINPSIPVFNVTVSETGKIKIDAAS